jgi:hypothetical protein
VPEETETLYDADGNPVEVTKPESANVKQMRERITQLEAEAKRAGELEAQLAGVQRQTALQAAGITLDDVKRSALEAVHQGEWTPEALQATAVSLGWMEQKNQPTPEEQAAQARTQAAQSGGTTTPPDPEAELDARIAAAKSPEELLEIYRSSGRPIAT